MTYANETTVKRILSLNEDNLEKAIKTKQEYYEQIKSETYLEDIKKYQAYLSYTKTLKKIVKKSKKQDSDKVAVAFIPNLKKMKKDKLFTSKIGGVPSCFLGHISKHLNNKEKCFEILKQKYPKSMGGSFLKYVGDIDFGLPASFLNLILDPIKTKDDKERIGQIAGEKRYGVDKFSAGSIFVNQNYGQYDCEADGIFHSLNHTWFSENYLEQFTDKEINTYISIMKNFLDTVVNKEESYSIDEYEPQEITSWTADVEAINEDYNEGESLGLKENTFPLFKIFGYPRSQQSMFPRYCINGHWGPRPMNSFLTLFSRNHDNYVQMFADLLNFNTAQEQNTMYIKTDISST